MTRNKNHHIIMLVIAGWLFASIMGCDGKNGSMTEPTQPDPTIQSPAGFSAGDDMSLQVEKIRAQAEARITELHKWTGLPPDVLLKPGKQVFWVQPGESIQEAVNAADIGALILIRPGIYTETVTVNTPNLTIIGMSQPDEEKVIIQNPDMAENGIQVMPQPGNSYLNKFTLYNVAVRGFEENGVFLARVRDFFIARTTTIDNGEYGIFPVHSWDGIVFQCNARGHADTGIYIGQSEKVWVLNNLATDNVLGVEIENCSYVVAAHNHCTNNTAGIMAVLLPPDEHITVTKSSHIWILENQAIDNNLENFANPPDLAAFVPRGSGILVVGVNNTHVSRNQVIGNDFVGVAVGSTLILAALAGLPPEAFQEIGPSPDGVKVQFNQVKNNGTNPPDLSAPLTGIGADLFWDGSGMDNCWWENQYETSIPSHLPECAQF